MKMTTDSFEPVAKRRLCPVTSVCRGDFSLVTYNCLADCYIDTNDYPFCAREYLFRGNGDKSMRHKTLLAEVK